LFSDDGTTRTIPEDSPGVVDDQLGTESIEDHKDMDELVKRYAPIFKLSYVTLFCTSLPCPRHIIREKSAIRSILFIRAWCGKFGSKLMVGPRKNGSQARSTLCWPSMIMYVPILPIEWKLITGGHMGWRADHSRELLLLSSFTD
jgi:hypothetical protein